MNKFTISAVATALAFGMVGLATANDETLQQDQNAATGLHPTFDSYDANKDGYLDQTEIAADVELTNSFGQYDGNADGRLERSEWDAYRMAGTQQDSTDYDETVEDEE